MKWHVHMIGIGGIGVSALARYYQHSGCTVSGSDSIETGLIHELRSEGMNIHIGSTGVVPPETTLIIYSEAIITQPDLPPQEQIYSHPELIYARDHHIPHLSYPQALGKIFREKYGIAVAGSHGKSTTTAMIATILAGSSVGGSAIVGTQVPTLGGKNFYTEDSPYFVAEACEYRRSFLHYHPRITVITNIDLDHLDYYRDTDDYISAFQALVNQTSDYVILSHDDSYSRKLHIPKEKKIIVGAPGDNGYTIQYWASGENLENHERFIESRVWQIPQFSLMVPGRHIAHDARLAYTATKLLGLSDEEIIARLGMYQGAWRRMEMIRTTKNGNLLISDYGHHPTEIRLTLEAIRSRYPDRELCVVFQPHQYSRTRELLHEFAVSFSDADRLIIPDIYFSRDREADVAWMTPDRLIEAIRPHQPHVEYGNGLTNTANLLQMYDAQKTHAIIVLLGAGNVDTLRDAIY